MMMVLAMLDLFYLAKCCSPQAKQMILVSIAVINNYVYNVNIINIINSVYNVNNPVMSPRHALAHNEPDCQLLNWMITTIKVINITSNDRAVA